MRTFKTGIAVFIVLLIFWNIWLARPSDRYLDSCFSLREDFDKRVSTSGLRVSWATVSEVLCRIVLPFKTLFHGAYWVTLIFVPIATMLTIMTNVAMNNKAGIIGGVSAMLIITLSIPNGETFLYVLPEYLGPLLAFSLRFWSIRMWIAFTIFSETQKPM